MKIALLGENVSQSLSPLMHNRAFQFLNLPFVYEAVSVPRDGFDSAFKKMRQEYAGFNITIPFKEEAAARADKLSRRAAKLSAANTVVLSGGEALGENTDVDGCLQALLECGYSPEAGGSALIIGAGGAAKATVEALSLLGERNFAAAGRSREGLDRFRNWFQSVYSPDHSLKILLFPELKADLSRFSLVVNAAPLEACKEIPGFHEIHFSKNTVVADWVYKPVKTPWLKKGEAAGAALVEGYRMLLYQGMKSFELWTLRVPPCRVMAEALLEALS